MNAPSHRPIEYVHYFPWTRLFRAFRIATDPRKLLLAAVGITLLWCGNAAISRLPFVTSPPAATPPWDAASPVLLIRWSEPTATFYDDAAGQSRALASRIVEPLRPLLSIAAMPFQGERSWQELAELWTRLFWSLAVWSVFGGAIARLAAVEFARDERAGLISSLKFSLRRFLSFFSAPLLPLAGILALWAVCAIGGSVGRIPLLGGWIVAASWFVAAAIGLLIVLATIALAAGWPLMVAAVATESSDAFDGFSRSFSYLYGRPWLFVAYTLVALLMGMLLVAAVDTVTVGLEAVASRTVATGMGEDAVAQLHADPPGYFAAAAASANADGQPVTGAARVAGFWLSAIATLAVGFAASYFWSAATIIYFLLRRADDATHFDDVWLSEIEEEDDLLPLAGIAASDQPVTERSHHPTVEPPVTTG